MNILQEVDMFFALQQVTGKQVRDIALYMSKLESELVAQDEQLKEVRERLKDIVTKHKENVDIINELLALEAYILQKVINK